MKYQAVIGAGFGDEGKGKVVSYLCSQSPKPIVVRYSGGQQAGHHVMLRDGREHVFANFGSGTLQGAPSMWTLFCTVDPVGIMNELDDLLALGLEPKLYLNVNCPVTTPFEKQHNKRLELNSKHGSCGVGVGQTYQREEDHFHISVMDLYNPSILGIKMRMIRDHYYTDAGLVDVESFIGACREVAHSTCIVPFSSMRNILPEYHTVIFEGSQGLLLDENHGFFPHVTRASVGTKNIAMLGYDPEIFLVTRAYQTRHGNGPMTNEKLSLSIPDNPHEKNFHNTFQGKFRSTILDIDLLKYAINCDFMIRSRRNVSLVVTCLDVIKNRYFFTKNSIIEEWETECEFVSQLKDHTRIGNVLLSRTPYPELETYSTEE